MDVGVSMNTMIKLSVVLHWILLWLTVFTAMMASQLIMFYYEGRVMLEKLP